jgi:hypothetical protein
LEKQFQVVTANLEAVNKQASKLADEYESKTKEIADMHHQEISKMKENEEAGVLERDGLRNSLVTLNSKHEAERLQITSDHAAVCLSQSIQTVRYI